MSQGLKAESDRQSTRSCTLTPKKGGGEDTGVIRDMLGLSGKSEALEEIDGRTDLWNKQGLLLR